MGSSFTCLASRGSKACEYSSGTSTLSPAHSIRRRSRSSSEQESSGNVSSLQEVVIAVLARALANGQIATREVSVLPIDLLQRVVDKLVQQDALSLVLLQGLISPWLHHLHLQGLSCVDDCWMTTLTGARHCRSLNISGATVSDAGASWLPWLWDLRELRLQHCTHITDAGLAQVCECVRLRVLDLEGCEGLTSACLASVAALSHLTYLNLGQVPGLKAHKLHHLTGLQELQHLSLGWCRGLTAAAAEPNSIQALACLTRLSHLDLGGTQVADVQLRGVLPHLKALKELDLSRSCCTAYGLGGLHDLAHSLRVLKLRGCQVCDAGAAALAELSQLVSLDLSCSSISSSGLLALCPLQALTCLNLDMCHVGDEACRVFRALTSLQELDLSDTDVGDGGVVHLRHCRRLARLGLCNTNCGDMSAASLAALTRVTHLNLDSRGITDACLPLLLPLGGCLKGLDLSGGRITSRGAAVLAGAFRGLTALELCGGHITDRSCSELSKLTLLRELNLSQNRSLSDNGLRRLAAGLGGSLCSLNLSYTSVTDDCVVTLAGMEALEVVVLSFSCVSEVGVERLQQARPRLLVKAPRRKSGPT